MIKKLLATAFYNKELNTFTHSTINMAAAFIYQDSFTSFIYSFNMIENSGRQNFKVVPKISSLVYIPCIILSSWMWVRPSNMMGYCSHDYTTLCGEGTLQKHLRSPISWFWVHQQGDDPQWTWPSQVKLIKRGTGTSSKEKKKLPWVLWVLQLDFDNKLKNSGEDSKPQMTATPTTPWLQSCETQSRGPS